MKNTHLRWSYILFIILLIALQGIFISYWYEKTLDDIGFNAMNISKVVANSIDLDKYEQLVEGKKRNSYFYEMQKYFRQVQQQTGVKYLYVEHKLSDSRIEYIFDAEKDSFGEEDDNSTPAAHSSKKSLSTRLQTYSVWGTLISGFTPLINKDGKIIGAVGVDVDQSFFYQELRSRIIKVLLYCITTILLFCLLITRLQREVTTRKAAQNELLKTADSLRNILNNSNQGFLTFGPDLLIDDEYSIKCEQFLGEGLSHTRYPDRVFPQDKQEAAFLEDIITDIFMEKDETRRDVFIPLIPSEAVVNGLHLEMEYKTITEPGSGSEKIMVILTDVTYKYLLQKQCEEEEKVLRMVVQAVVNRDVFLESVKDYQEFCRHTLGACLNSAKSMRHILSELLISVHTFKGGFSQLEMVNVVTALHDLESRLAELKPQIDHLPKKDLQQFIQEHDMVDWLEKDLNLLRDILGADLLTQEPVIEESKLARLEEKLSKILPPDEYLLVLKETRRMRNKPFKNLLKSHPQYTMKLAERLEKQIHPFGISGGDFEVNTAYYRDFANSMIHVFRNSIDHGIESIQERLETGKKEFGTITCKVELTDNVITIRLADDGRGIDTDVIKNLAIAKNIYDEETISRLTKKEITTLVFAEYLSAKSDITELSGRGIGLSAVKRELDRLGGWVEISSVSGQGTEFVFYIPLLEE